MTEARLNHLMLLYVHNDKTSALCMAEIANDVVRESKRTKHAQVWVYFENIYLPILRMSTPR